MSQWTLTEEAKAKIPEWNARWIDIIRRVDPMTAEERVMVDKAVRDMYASAKLEAPKAVVFVASPLAAAIAAGTAAADWHLHTAAMENLEKVVQGMKDTYRAYAKARYAVSNDFTANIELMRLLNVERLMGNVLSTLQDETDIAVRDAINKGIAEGLEKARNIASERAQDSNATATVMKVRDAIANAAGVLNLADDTVQAVEAAINIEDTTAAIGQFRRALSQNIVHRAAKSAVDALVAVAIADTTAASTLATDTSEAVNAAINMERFTAVIGQDRSTLSQQVVDNGFHHNGTETAVRDEIAHAVGNIGGDTAEAVRAAITTAVRDAIAKVTRQDITETLNQNADMQEAINKDLYTAIAAYIGTVTSRASHTGVPHAELQKAAEAATASRVPDIRRLSFLELQETMGSSAYLKLHSALIQPLVNGFDESTDEAIMTAVSTAVMTAIEAATGPDSVSEEFCRQLSYESYFKLYSLLVEPIASEFGDDIQAAVKAAVSNTVRAAVGNSTITPSVAMMNAGSNGDYMSLFTAIHTAIQSVIFTASNSEIEEIEAASDAVDGQWKTINSLNLTSEVIEGKTFDAMRDAVEAATGHITMSLVYAAIASALNDSNSLYRETVNAVEDVDAKGTPVSDATNRFNGNIGEATGREVRKAIYDAAGDGSHVDIFNSVFAAINAAVNTAINSSISEALSNATDVKGHKTNNAIEAATYAPVKIEAEFNDGDDMTYDAITAELASVGAYGAIHAAVQDAIRAIFSSAKVNDSKMGAAEEAVESGIFLKAKREVDKSADRNKLYATIKSELNRVAAESLCVATATAVAKAISGEVAANISQATRISTAEGVAQAVKSAVITATDKAAYAATSMSVALAAKDSSAADLQETVLHPLLSYAVENAVSAAVTSAVESSTFGEAAGALNSAGREVFTALRHAIAHTLIVAHTRAIGESVAIAVNAITDAVAERCEEIKKQNEARNKFVGECIKASSNMRAGGNQWAAWDAFLCFVRDVVKWESPTFEAYNAYAICAQHSGPRYLHEKFCIVSDFPTQLHAYTRNGVLVAHNESGPSHLWSDGFAIWTIHGVQVDEQIVMHPETQTLDQISAEENAEIKRIRIERYGWPRYLQETDAKVIDFRRNDIDQTDESLMAVEGASVLVCACKSTARVYCMRVPAEVQTCADAQNWLNSGARIIGAS